MPECRCQVTLDISSAVVVQLAVLLTNWQYITSEMIKRGSNLRTLWGNPSRFTMLDYNSSRFDLCRGACIKSTRTTPSRSLNALKTSS